jgi:hypothetical protein
MHARWDHEAEESERVFSVILRGTQSLPVPFSFNGEGTRAFRGSFCRQQHGDALPVQLP